VQGDQKRLRDRKWGKVRDLNSETVSPAWQSKCYSLGPVFWSPTAISGKRTNHFLLYTPNLQHRTLLVTKMCEHFPAPTILQQLLGVLPFHSFWHSQELAQTLNAKSSIEQAAPTLRANPSSRFADHPQLVSNLPSKQRYSNPPFWIWSFARVPQKTHESNFLLLPICY
jgi:hypothetical protein